MNGTTSGRGVIGRSAFIAGSILHLATGCWQQDPARSDVTRPVKTMVVTAGGESRVRAFPGKAEASKKAELTFQVPGLLVRLPAKEGQRVAKGEIIGQLRPAGSRVS
jgi:multidrug efflux pump subunit AcrA (membrane-fusion protein)